MTVCILLLCVLSAVQADVHVTWLDNFSKFYAIAVQGLAGAAEECLWTAHGLHPIRRPSGVDSLGAQSARHARAVVLNQNHETL